MYLMVLIRIDGSVYILSQSDQPPVPVFSGYRQPKINASNTRLGRVFRYDDQPP